jgi:hypothetical protein
MMELLGQHLQQVYEYSKKRLLAGAGTQPAALAFGGDTPASYKQQKNLQ